MANLFQYIKDTRQEMTHVSWPTRMQTIGFTAMVVIISVLVALYLGFFDFVFTKGMQAAFEHAPRFSNVFSAGAAPEVDVEVGSSTAATSSDIIITPIEEEE